MHQTWKCDFCTHTNSDPKKVELHEKECTFNPSKKSCYTCKFCYEDGAPISGYYNACEKEMSTIEGEDGNCSEWIISEELTTKLINKKVKEF